MKNSVSVRIMAQSRTCSFGLAGLSRQADSRLLRGFCRKVHCTVCSLPLITRTLPEALGPGPGIWQELCIAYGLVRRECDRQNTGYQKCTYFLPPPETSSARVLFMVFSRNFSPLQSQTLGQSWVGWGGRERCPPWGQADTGSWSLSSGQRVSPVTGG